MIKRDRYESGPQKQSRRAQINSLTVEGLDTEVLMRQLCED